MARTLTRQPSFMASLTTCSSRFTARRYHTITCLISMLLLT
ncbi:hypothetical protein EVA_14984 [gut metagenome]|uniref:Uncharacterized protein n=1 Tax=gut metagenome TaxID=749906 RepID=J9GBX4_9ZZZZ